MIFILSASLITVARGIPQGTEEFFVNGLKVIVKPNTANEINSVNLCLKGGSLNLEESTQGIEPLIFYSAIKGSEKYATKEVNAILDRTAASISSSSNRDFSVVSLRCVRIYFDETWDLFADAILHPTLAPDQVKLVRETMLVTIRGRKDDPDTYLNELSMKSFFDDHPYRWNPQGVESSVANISIERMKAYLRDHLQTSRLLLVVVGNVNKEDLRKKIETSFGTLPRGDYASSYPVMKQHVEAKVAVMERDLPTNYIRGDFSAPSMRDTDYYSMTVAMDILASRIFEEVRTKRNLSYAPAAFYSNMFSNLGTIYVTAVSPDTTIRVMMEELKKMQHEPVTAKDLRASVNTYLTRYFLNNETDGAQATFLARWELSGKGWQEGEKFVEHLKSVTADDVLRVANTHFQHIQFTIIGNPKLIDQKVFTSM